MGKLDFWIKHVHTDNARCNANFLAIVADYCRIGKPNSKGNFEKNNIKIIKNEDLNARNQRQESPKSMIRLLAGTGWVMVYPQPEISTCSFLPPLLSHSLPSHLFMSACTQVYLLRLAECSVFRNFSILREENEKETKRMERREKCNSELVSSVWASLNPYIRKTSLRVSVFA